MMGRLAATAVALTLISTSLMGGTLAKYTTEVSGTGTADVAVWKVEFKEGTTEWGSTAANNTFTLADTATNASTNHAANKVAPGSTGSFVLHIDGTGTEVAFDYTIKIDTTNLKTVTNSKAIPIKFYSDASFTTEIPSTGFTGTVAVADATKKKDQTIYWKWVTANDAGDTEVGTDAGSANDAGKGTFKVTMTATQKIGS